MSMLLRHAILGLLDLAPRSGYDLDRAFQRSVAHFWHADKSQIYRTLDRLEADGAIETEVVAQQTRPDRRVHSLSSAGRAELREWLESPLEDLRPKEPFLARLFFAATLGTDGVLDLVDRREREIREALDDLRGLPRPSGDLAALLRAATLDAGIAQAEAELAWLDAVRGAVRSEQAS